MTRSSKRKTIIALAIAFVLLLTAYFILTRVIWRQDEGTLGGDVPTYTPPTLAPGEYFSTKQGTLSLYTHSAIANVQAVTVYTGKTEDGARGDTYSIVRNAANVLVLEGYEGLALHSASQSVFYAFCNPITQKRITNGENTFSVVYTNGSSNPADHTVVTDVPLRQYGLDPVEDDPAYYELTVTGVATHRVYVGAQTPLKDGYYCRYEGRNEIYVLSATYGAAKMNKEVYLTPTVVQTNANSQMPYLDRFVLYRDGEIRVDVKYDSTKIGTASEDAIKVRFSGKGDYGYIGNDVLMKNIFSSYIQLVGNQVLKIVPRSWTEEERAEKLPALLAEYGISMEADENPYAVIYGWDGITKEELEDAGIEGVEGDIDEMLLPLLFSEKSADNTYNVYCIIIGQVKKEDGTYESVLYEQIVEINASKFYYLESPAVAFVRQSIYSGSISNVGSLSFTGSYTDRGGVSHSVNESYVLNHRDKTSVDASGKTKLEDAYSLSALNAGFILEEGKTTNFAMLYALFLSNPQYFASLELTQAQKEALRAQGPLATITLTEIAREEAKDTNSIGELKKNPDGSVVVNKTYTYSFYRYSSTLVLLSLDGGLTFDFAVSYAPLNELLENADRVANQKQVTVACSNQMASLPSILGK